MPMRHSAARARRSRGHAGDLDAQPMRPVADPEHRHVGQPDKQRAHARRISFHRGSRDSTTLDTVRFAEPLYRARDHLPDSNPTLRSEEPGKTCATGDTLAESESQAVTLRQRARSRL